MAFDDGANAYVVQIDGGRTGPGFAITTIENARERVEEQSAAAVIDTSNYE